MIASLRGTVSSKGLNEAVLDVQGVGYRVAFSLLTLARLPEDGESATVRIRTVVREDALELYGFLSSPEEEMFLLLTSVAHVGPKLALSVLSGLELPELVAAIGRGEVARLTRIHGVGKKTAERLVLELKDKVKLIVAGGKLQEGAAPLSPVHGPAADLISALVNLGYKPVQAQEAATAASERSGSDAPFEALFREALKRLRTGR